MGMRLAVRSRITLRRHGVFAAAAAVVLSSFVAVGGAAHDAWPERDVPLEEEPTMMTIQSDAFPHEGEIPRKYTCEGDDVSPPLTFGEPPTGTKSFALIVEDPDAPDPKAPKTTWVHWVLYSIPAATRELPEDVRDLPRGTLEGTNSWKRTGYGGPCPPIGRHRYFFKLFALDVVLDDLDEPTSDELDAAMDGHILGNAILLGTYEKG